MKRFVPIYVLLALVLSVAVSANGTKELELEVTRLEEQVSSLEKQKDTLEELKSGLEEENRVLKEIAGPLPASLDKFFPPIAPVPVFLFEMFALAGPFEGIMIDLQQGDIAGVQTNYEAFKAQYEKLAGFVPEWKDRFPNDPVDNLGEALKSSDPQKIGQAMGQVGQTCGSCHLLFQAKAFQQYHWGDFHAIKITDPLSKESLEFDDFMIRLAGSFGGIGNDLAQGQLDNARNNFSAFSTQFETFSSKACVECHKDPAGNEIPRKYFVDENITQLIAQLGQALEAETPDAAAIQQLSGAIGNESCMKCHLVHVPAAKTKEIWKEFSTLFEN